jgi:hypothetical protein
VRAEEEREHRIPLERGGLRRRGERQWGVLIAVNDMHEWLSGRTYAENAARAKVVIDDKTDRMGA